MDSRTNRRVSTPRKTKRRSGDSFPAPRSFDLTDKKGKEKTMAASFLQFCAMCEKQIMTPCNSILYCSEACRRKDAAKPLSASNVSADLSSPPSSPLSIQRSPVARAESHDLPTSRIPADLHDHKSDLDPTEWKPKLQRGASANSEAYRYLSRFHQATSGEDHLRVERPFPYRHKSALSMSTLAPGTTTPSLANTPTTAASSMDSRYEYCVRPLGPRTDPSFASSVRSIDLVTPHIPPPLVNTNGAATTSAKAASLDLWGKKIVIAGSTPNGEGLGALFSKAA